MKELKFRAWHKGNKRMVCPMTLSFLCHENPLWVLGGHVEDYEWMQYTGLKDKNGKEIYEGDIVAHLGKDIAGHTIESRYPVCFGKYDNGEGYEDAVYSNGWYLGQEQFFRAGKRETGGWETRCAPLTEAKHLEIIGNIYEQGKE